MESLEDHSRVSYCPWLFASGNHVERFREGILLDVSVFPGPDKVMGKAVGGEWMAAPGGGLISLWGNHFVFWTRLQLLLEGDLDKESHGSDVWWCVAFKLPG